MSGENPQEDFNKDRAELFEALGHPTRIKILQTISKSPLSFSELKKETCIESNGLLSFHLSKLNGLIKTVEGNYTLTDEGREAMRVVAHSDIQNHTKKRRISNAKLSKVALVFSIIVIIGLASSIYYKETWWQLHEELEQVRFIDARITSFNLSQDTSHPTHGVLSFRYQMYYLNPNDHPFYINIFKTSIHVLVNIDYYQNTTHMSDFLLEDNNYQVITADPYSTIVISGTAYWNGEMEQLVPMHEYLSVNGIQINHIWLDTTFSKGIPFISIFAPITPSVSPDQEPRY